MNELGVDTGLFQDYANGHAVPKDAESLEKIYDFLTSHLSAPEVLETIEMAPSSNPHKLLDLHGRKNTRCKGFQIKDGQIIFVK